MALDIQMEAERTEAPSLARSALGHPWPADAGRCSRSSVPDLLFDDVRDERVEEIRKYIDHPEAVNADTALHRVTFFLTYRCNLTCPYCKTIARDERELREFPQKGVSYTYDEFRNLMDSLAESPTRHIHFTGGEATLVRGLPEMVRLVKEKGIQYASITSNGTVPFRVYAKLVESGMDEIRISIDAYEPGTGDALAGRRGAWERTVRTIQDLAAYRDSGRQFFLIANTVAGLRNRAHLAGIVRFLLSLGPDDIKLITEVQKKGSLGDFPEAKAVLGEIEEMLSLYPADAYPLLRKKIKTVFHRESIGLEDVRPAPDGSWHCYIPLTERTVDGVYYYPCSVYLREGGKPLGKISDPMSEQRAKTAEFVQNGDCLNDPICRKFCLHCTREYNVRCNEARS